MVTSTKCACASNNPSGKYGPEDGSLDGERRDLFSNPVLRVLVSIDMALCFVILARSQVSLIWEHRK